MAKTKDGKKKVYVKEHSRGDSSVRKHYRSTPNPRERSSSDSGRKGLFGMLFGRK